MGAWLSKKIFGNFSEPLAIHVITLRPFDKIVKPF